MRPNLSTAIRTLVLGGYQLRAFERNPHYALLVAERIDEFGIPQPYAFALAEDSLTAAQVAAARTAAVHHRAHLVLIASQAEENDHIEWLKFLSLFGGPVYSATPLQPEFKQQLLQLGLNELPDGHVGQADDLFEAYVQVALEFILWDRVVRYGQSRRFEARPDGLVFKQDFVTLYDVKAAATGYDVDLNTIRQFKTYVEGFRETYRSFLPEMNSFLVVSSSFNQGFETLASRSRDLQATCGVPLVFMTTTVLIEIVELLKQHPTVRRSLPWKRILMEPVVSAGGVTKAIEALEKDGIISRQ